MIAWRTPMLSTTVALLALSATTAIGQTSLATAPDRTATSFLAPLPARLMVTPTSSPFCRSDQGHRCPPVLVYGGAAGPGLPTIDPAFKLDLPNVRVSFVLQSIANTAVANGGVIPDANTFVLWTTTGAAASQEHSGPFGYTVPPPGVTWDSDEIYHAVIYDALVLGACESFAPFPVDHEAVIDDGGNQLGTFHGIDNSTLDHTGFYNFSYKVRATGVNGRVSDFKFAGKVNVTCSGINSLP